MRANALGRLGSRPDIFWLAAGIALFAGAVIRLANINQFGFNSDEAVYAGQAAALAGNQSYADMFGIFRAHPLLVQFMVAVLFKLGGVNDLVPRLVAVITGLALVCVAGAFALRTGNRGASLIALVLAALSPYAIVISRQFLLDGPMALFCALSLFFVVVYIRRPSSTSLVAAAAAAGLAFLAKETGILLLPAYILFFLVCPSVPLGLRSAIQALGVYLLTVAPFPLALLLGGGNRIVGQYAAWQVLRRPNHTPDFYLHVLPDLGLPMVIFAIVGIVFALRRRNPEDVLLLCFIAVTFGFFQLWPVKGYQYLVVLVMPAAVLAADGLLKLAALLARIPESWRPPTFARARMALVAASVVVLAGSLAAASGVSPAVDATSDEQAKVVPQTFLAGSGGLEAGRPAGLWVNSHTPPGSRFLTIGPSFANVIQFYGQRVAQALSVSPNPLHRNPAYEPVGNPDLEIRSGRFQYLVYDAYSASRTPYFAAQLQKYVTKHDGTAIYTGRVSMRQSDGKVVEVPTVVIYEVHP
ncbi:MAG: ArnT family glycosyltransferase [Candidatus Dormibacteraceae bacterium]